MLKYVTIVATLALLSGCSTTAVGLKYAAPPSVSAVAPATPVILGPFSDQREKASTWLGAIRGGFGNHLKDLEAERPVAEIVRDAFADGLRARGVAIDPAGRNQITGIVRRLYCSQYVRREAYANVEIVVRDKTGQQRFSRLYTASNVDGSLITLDAGIFASVEDLRALLEKTLREAVDKALDDSELRAALQS